jgi:hypothetical protein
LPCCWFCREPSLHALAVTTIAAALIAALSSYTHAQRLQRIRARLERLNAHLGEFLGPLYATLEASRIRYQRLLDRIRPRSSSLFGPDSPAPNEEELRLFRRRV